MDERFVRVYLGEGIYVDFKEEYRNVRITFRFPSGELASLTVPRGEWERVVDNLRVGILNAD